MSSTQTRVPSGVPSGGQFATSARADAAVSLGNDATTAPPTTVGAVFVMGPDEFAERFGPGEYQRSGAGWDEVEDHPAFLERNPFNPDRIHAGTWDDFVADIGTNGLREPVEIDPYSEEVSEGHHRVVAALKTGQPVRFTVAAPEGSWLQESGQALARSLLDDDVSVDAADGSRRWRPETALHVRRPRRAVSSST